MKFTIHALLPLLLFALAPAFGDEVPPDSFRILSWNISDDAFVTHPNRFVAVLRKADADILLLDEVSPAADADHLRKVLDRIQTENDAPWNIEFGASGGRQRVVFASRLPLTAITEFATMIPYPDAEKQQLLDHMPPRVRANIDYTMDDGIPVNAVIVRLGDKRLLIAGVDLQCCGNDPRSWQEVRRRVETTEIRNRLRVVLEQNPVDGMIIGGDFNLVSTPLPKDILRGPYPSRHSGLVSADIYHPDGTSTWTWDGSGTPFPSSKLDFQLYSPADLRQTDSSVIDIVNDVSRHRPLVAEYAWSDDIKRPASDHR